MVTVNQALPYPLVEGEGLSSGHRSWTKYSK